MPVRALVADDNLDVQELVNDILHINYRDVSVDRALDFDGLCSRLRDADPRYDLLIAAATLGDAVDTPVVSVLQSEFAEYLPAAVKLQEAPGQVPVESGPVALAVLTKPFSLDDFCDCIKRICPR